MTFSTELPVTVTDSATGERLARGIDGFNRWRRDALGWLDAAAERDPRCVLAHTTKGMALWGGRNNRLLADARDCLQRAESAAAELGGALSLRERQHLAALRELLSGRPEAAVVLLETVLERYPSDLLAHRLVQQELFWTGQRQRMRRIAAGAFPAWSEADPGYDGLLAVYAFSHEECGDYDIAESAGRLAIERAPDNCWAAHAVAHVLEMQGRGDEGVDWLESLCGNWGEANQIAHHLWWHLCLFYLERGDHERIFELLDRHVRNPDDPLVQAVPDAYIDIQNVASLLLRLELRGVAVPAGRWQALADVSAQRIGNHPSPFTSAHAAMVLAACGRFEQAEQLVQSLRDDIAAGGAQTQTLALAALPATEAVIAHRRGDDEAVRERLWPARGELYRMGGSHAQRDIFLQLLADACHRLERRDDLGTLLDEQRAIGFARVEERTLYRDIAAGLQAR